MADYQFNTDLTPKVQGTNLSDMVNLARGIQSYQQAEQINPLAVEKSKEEVNQARIGTQSAQMKLGGEKMQKFLDTVGARAVDPELISAIEAKDKDKVKTLISGDLQELITNKVFTPAEAMQAGARMLDLADSNLDAVVPALKNLVTRAASSESRLGLQTGETVTIGDVKYQFNKATGELKQIGATGGATKPLATQQKGEQLFREDMPIVPGAVMQLNERQKTRFDEGEKIFAESTNQMNSANEMTQSIRKIEETIGSAAGSKPGQLVRDALKGIMGNAQLETLTKNLEDLYVRNIGALGGDTDAARESIKKISGGPDMTIEALQGIIDRVKGSTISLKKFNQGFDNYAKNTSTENANIHARQFRNAWVQNADPLVFMAQSINASKKTPEQKEEMRKKILLNLTPDEISDLKTKAQNIKLLEAGQRVKEND